MSGRYEGSVGNRSLLPDAGMTTTATATAGIGIHDNDDTTATTTTTPAATTTTTNGTGTGITIHHTSHHNNDANSDFFDTTERRQYQHQQQDDEQQYYSPFLNNVLRFSPKPHSIHHKMTTTTPGNGISNNSNSTPSQYYRTRRPQQTTTSTSATTTTPHAQPNPSTTTTTTSSSLVGDATSSNDNDTERTTTTTTTTTRRFFASSTNDDNGNMDDDDNDNNNNDDDLNLMNDNNNDTWEGDEEEEKGNDRDRDDNNKQNKTTHTRPPKKNYDDDNDGILPIEQLRSLVQSSLISSSSSSLETALFYSQIIYAKTQSAHDAMVLATCQYRNHHYDACLRIIEESQLLFVSSSLSSQQQQPHQPLSPPLQDQGVVLLLFWDAALLATQALTAKRDFITLIDLLEDVCRISSPAFMNNASNINNNNSNNSYDHPVVNSNSHYSFMQQQQTSQPLEDDDQIGWMTLKRIITSSSSSNNNNNTSNKGNSQPTQRIHPLSVICYYRGLGYHETGCTIRATTYWKLSFMMDVYNQLPYTSLMEHNLLSIPEAYELITQHVVDDDGDDSNGIDELFQPRPQPQKLDWLRSLYLSRIELTTAMSSGTITRRRQQELQPDSKTSTVLADTSNISTNNNHNSIAATAAKSAAIGISINIHGTTSLDASSIQLSSPIPTFHIGSSMDVAPSNTALSMIKNDHDYDMDDNNEQQQPQQMNNITTTKSILSSTHAIQRDIDEAFHNLFHKYGLQNSSHVLAVAARRSYRRYDWTSAVRYCQDLAQLDPTVTEAAFCYIATLVMLGHKRVLFRLAHEWVDATPKSARSWFAVGAYYYSIHRFHIAQRHFCRATRMNPQCTEAWIALGCAFAACDESDQALASFRAAQRLSPGEHSSLLYMGMEYIRTNHLVLASHFLQAALSASGGDPLCLHEMGVLAAQKGDHTDAIYYFRELMSAIGGDWESLRDTVDLCYNVYWEPTIFNLGHSYRKCRQFDNAIICFHRCITLCPEKYSAYSALAFTKHLRGDIDDAISFYHKALALQPDDPFSTDMLSRALQDQITTKTQDIFNVGLPPLPKAMKTTTPLHSNTRFLSTPNVTSGQKTSDSVSGDDMDLDFDMSVTS